MGRLPGHPEGAVPVTRRTGWWPYESPTCGYDAAHVQNGALNPDLWTDLLGVPYLSGGRDKAGLDCLGLVLMVQRRMGYDPPDPVRDYDARAPGRLFVDHVGTGWRRVLEPEPGDAILVRLGAARWHNHVAVMISAHRALQVHAGAAGVAQVDVRPWIEDRRVDGFYRPVAAPVGRSGEIQTSPGAWVRMGTISNWFDRSTLRTWTEPLRAGSVLDLCPAEYLGPDTIILHNGARLTALDAGRVVPRPGDEIIYAVAPGVPAFAAAPGGAIVGIFGLTGAAPYFAAFGINLAIGSLLGFLASLISTPAAGKPDKSDDASPTYNLDGFANRAINGASIPVIYGTHRVGGQIIQLFTRANAQFKSTLYMMLALGEGELQAIAGLTTDSNNIDSSAISGSNVEIDGNAVSGFRNITLHTRKGATEQDLIPGFEETVTPASPNVVLRRSTTFTPPNSCQVIAENDQTYSYSTTTEIDAFEINITFPIGLYSINGDGDTQQFSFCATMSYERTGDTSSKVTEFLYLGPSTVRANHTRTVRRNVPIRDKYTIYLTRVTYNDDEQERRFSTSEISTINEILTTSALAYPGLALLAIEALGSEQLGGGVPTVTALVQGKRVWVWDGVSTTSPNFTLEFSSNPAWVVLDILLNKRYGLGNYVTLNEIDLDSFDDWADYCDASITTDGTSHVRWSFNGVFDTARPAWEAVQQVAACGRGVILLSGSKFRAKFDQATTPTQLFTMGNVVAGSFSMTYLDTTSRPTFVEVEYRNEDLDYDRDVAQLESGTLAVTDLFRKQTTSLIGLTMPEQAYRAAKYMLNVSTGPDKRLTFDAPIDAVVVEPMDTIWFQHETVSSTYGGRVAADVASASAGVAIDQDVVIPASPAWNVIVRCRDTVSGAEAFSALPLAPGTYAAGSVIPLASGSWSSTALPKKHDIYGLGPATTYIKEWRVVRRSVTPKLNVKLECLEYLSSVYTDDPGEIESFTDRYPDSRVIPPKPTAVVATEITRRRKDGTIDHVLDVSFARAVGTYLPVAHDVWVRRVASTDTAIAGDEAEQVGGVYAWRLCGSTATDRFEIREGLNYRAAYEVSVAPRGPHGTSADPNDGARTQVLCVGKTEEPAAPTGLLAYDRGDRTLLSWTPTPERDVKEYDVRAFTSSETFAAWFFAQKVAPCVPCPFVEFYPYDHGNPIQLLVKARNTSGVPSLSPVALTYTPSSSPSIVVINTAESTAWPGTKTNCAVTGTYLRTTLGQVSGSYVTGDTTFALSKRAMIVQVLAHLVAMELDTTVAEAGYGINSPHAARLLVDSTLLDHPDPEWEYPINAADYPLNSPMGQTINIDQSQDWETLHAVTIEYDLATDDPPTVWAGYKTYVAPFFVQDKTYMRLRISFTNAATGRYQTDLRALRVKGLRLALFEAGTATQSGTSFKAVTFANTYPSAPTVFAEPSAPLSGHLVTRQNPTATAIEMRVVDQNGEPVSGASFRYFVAGP